VGSLLSIQKSPEVDIIVDFVQTLHPKNVLEVGCNFGRELKFLEELTKVHGIDKDAEKIEKAKAYVHGSFKVADASLIPTSNNRFDLVYGTGVFCHNPPEKITQFINEMYRVSKKYILIVEYVGSHLSRNIIGNCKQNTWIHDYDLLISKLNVIIKYNQRKFFGTDCFQVLLLEKVLQPKVTQNIFIEPKCSRFMLKIGKFKVEIK
jgi:SAM-dependent methyltransferase